jgi:hypothetical protein
MYRKNTGSQYIYFVLVNASSGAALTGATVTAYRALDGGSQASATGTTTELANGQYRFNLSQADTNADYGSYLFTATNAVPVEKTVVFTGADVTAAALGAALASNYTATRAGYLDGVLIAANYNQRTVSVTGSNHVAADIHELQPGVITAGDFASGAITSTVLATDSITSSQIAASAVTEIQSGLATTTQLTTVEGKIDAIDDYVDTEVAAVKAVTDKLNTTVELDGAVYRFTTNALEQGPSGTTTVNVMPLSSTATQRVAGTTITTFLGDRSDITIAVFDSTGTAVNLTAQGTLEVVIERRDGTDLQVIPNASITISGGSSNQATFTPDATAVGTLGQHLWALRRTANEQVLAHGNFVVAVAAFDN